MPRKLRVEYPGAIYHVMSRGDRQDFLKTLAESCQKSGWQVRAYCLMNNHFHLVVETTEANLVEGMRWLLSAYTIRLNHRHNSNNEPCYGLTPRMKSSQPSSQGETRFVFRVLAGIIAAFLLLIGLPAALSEARSGGWEAWVCALSCLYAGVGLALGARTGRWFDFGSTHDPRA